MTEPVLPAPVAQLVDAMLVDGMTAPELHEQVDDAVDWIERHPAATRYQYPPPEPPGHRTPEQERILAAERAAFDRRRRKDGP